MSSTLTCKIYEFENFRLIPGEGLLFQNGTPVSLNPKAFAVLAMLVEHHGHLVSKAEILDAIWEGAFVEEGAISKSVWFVRNALGDTSKERFVQTIPKRGYRFVAPVSVVEDSGAFRLPDLARIEYQNEGLVVGTEKPGNLTGDNPVIAREVDEAQAFPISAKRNPENGAKVAGNNGINDGSLTAGSTPNGLAAKRKPSTVKRPVVVALLLFIVSAVSIYFLKYSPIEGTTANEKKSIAVL